MTDKFGSWPKWDVPLEDLERAQEIIQENMRIVLESMRQEGSGNG